MIILNCHTGRMSNHKIMLAHVMARALSRDERWHVTDERNGFWRLERATIGRVWNKLVRMLPEAQGSRCRCLRLSGLMIVHGFTEFRDFENLKKYGEEIREKFGRMDGLDDWKVEKVEGVERGEKEEIVVGIHKRRGDYRTWKGGRYFYGDDVWERVEREMREELRKKVEGVERVEGERVKFEVFSDEGATRSAEEDQALMARCDYLIGPPSTFSSWASFMGQVPLLHLLTADQTIRLEDFRVYGE